MNIEEFDSTDTRALRLKAEQILKEKQRKIDKLLAESDAKKLLHELQVHQIELEMQNEELRQAQETAEIALKKYTMLYDLAPMGYLTLKKDGKIRELNFTAADMIGERRFSLVNSNFKFFISEESMPVFNKFIDDIFSSKSKESCEVMLGNETRSSRRVYMEGVTTDDNQTCLLSVVDISNFIK